MYKLLISFILILVASAQVYAGGYYYARPSGASLWDGASPMEDSHCVAAWYMNSATDETDRSGSSETLTEAGDIPTSATVPSGYSGTSRVINTTEGLSHANGGSADLAGADQSYTFCVWAAIDSDSSADNYLWDNYEITGDNRQYRMYFDDSADYIRWDMSATGTFETVISCNGGASTNRATLGSGFHHFCFVYNDTTMKIYLDNVEVGTADHTAGCTAKTGVYTLGAYDTADAGNLNWYGKLDEPIWFNIALSSDQRADIIANGISGNKGGSD